MVFMPGDGPDDPACPIGESGEVGNLDRRRFLDDNMLLGLRNEMGMWPTVPGLNSLRIVHGEEGYDVYGCLGKGCLYPL